MIRLANIFDTGRSVSWVNSGILKLAGTITAPQIHGNHGRLNNRLHELFSFSSLPALLRYEDRNSMAFSVEARLPFLDHRLVSFLFSLPADQKVRHGMTKYVMRESLTGVVPESIRTRTDKIGFSTPEAEWYRKGTLSYMRDILNDDTTKKRGLYDCPKLMNLIESNAAGKVDAGRALWRALNLELWFRHFVD
jgi:asparagine synthase (glutamine-hydrolysing)